MSAAGKKKLLLAGRGDRREQIASGIYFKQGTLFHPDARDEQGAPLQVDEWHYQILSVNETVMGHGDGYLDEEHVRSALASVLDDYRLPWAEGKPREIDARDAEIGKRSATDTPKPEVTA